MTKQKVLISGITGMDGSILADLLLAQDYIVYGLVRRNASPNPWRIKHLINHPNLHLIDGDITTQDSIHRAIEQAQPHFIYNLAAQSFVPYSWAAPVSTFQITALGAINFLEGIRAIDKKIKFYQASSSEMFGKVLETPQKETTPFYPRSPYGIAKCTAHYATVNYHESFGIHATSGILFNHEHERRGEQFVTRKITKGVAQFIANKLRKNKPEPVRLGNLEAKRDWGYAEDFVKGMIKIVNHPTPETFVLATGVTRTVRQWCEATVAAAKKATAIDSKLEWKGTQENEIGYLDNEPLFVVAKEFYRPAEVDLLLGDFSKAEKLLKWQPSTSFEQMVEKMFRFDFNQATSEK